MKKINKNDKPKNDIIYTRVSTGEQVVGFSLDNQEKFCRDLSKRDEHSVLRVFREEGESAKTINRTRLQEMLRFCESNRKQIDRVVIYKVDRFSRQNGDYHVLKACLIKMGISLVSATESFDDTPGGKFLENMLSSVAQFDNDVKSCRTIEGMRARLLKGLWSGVAPWGYFNTKDELGNKIIVPHPEKAPVVKMLFEQYSTGKYSFAELASMANKMGVKSRHGMKIGKQLVAKIIANPIHCGKIVVSKFDVYTQGSHEPIITESLFNEANSENKGMASHKVSRNKDNQDYPLRGIKCGGCGGSISGGRTKGKTKYYQYYGCINKECKKRTAIKKVDLENDFTKFLAKITPDDNYLNALREAIKITHKSELQSMTSVEQKLTLRMTELKDKKNKLLDLIIEGKISDEDFIPANEKYKIQISDLEREVNNLSVPELGVDEVIDSSIEFLKNLSEKWQGLDVKDLRVLKSLLFPENLVYEYPTIKTPKLCSIYKIKTQFDDEETRLVTLPGIEPGLTA